MEGLRKRTLILAVGFIAIGLGFRALARSPQPDRTEEWMQKVTPKEVPGYRMEKSPTNPEISYKSDKMVYDTLVPYGIVARVFQEEKGNKSFDVNVIASSTKDSFHDPRVCFTAQGWNIDKETRAVVKTQTRGDVPVTLAEMTHAKLGKHPSVFFYKGPDGFTATTAGLKIQMLKHQFLTLRDQEGTFYRVIALSRDTTTEELLEFTGKWLDEANKVSDGFF
jgi:hypothetical protein